MPITLITGPANAGKARVVIDAVERHVARGREPILIVPTRADAEHYRRELAAREVVLGVRVERFEGLIDEAVRRARAGAGPTEGSGTVRPVLGRLARARVLAAILERGAPGGAGASRGMVRAAGAFVAELQVRRVTPRRLREALREWSPAHGDAREVGGLFEEYHRVLVKLGRVDREQRATRALDALRQEPGLWERTPVAFYGFDDLTQLQLDAIETLGGAVDAEVTVSLTFEPGRTAFAGRAGTFQMLEPLAAEHTRMEARADCYASTARIALGHLERSLFEPEAGRVEAGEAVRLLEGGGERAEMELVAGEVRALLEGGMRAGEIAVVLRAPAAAADLIEEIFGSAGIPYALERQRSFADTGIGRALIGLLRSVPSPGPSSHPPAEASPHPPAEASPHPSAEVSPHPSADPSSHPSTDSSSHPPAEAGGGVSEQAGGRMEDLLAWLRAPGLLERPELADRLEARALRKGVAGAAGARTLWEESNWPLETIDHLRDAAALGERALMERAARELQWLFDAPRRGRAPVLDDDELDEARALAIGHRALGELRELARADSSLVPGDAAGLATLLEGLELVSGERASTETVAVLDPLALRARRVKALFLCGLQEGVFPAPARAQPLLGEEERRALAEASGLRLDRTADGLAAERYLLYAAVSRPEQLLVLSWHTAEDDGAPVAPSLFVEDVCDLFEEGLRERRVRRPLGMVDRSGSERRSGRGIAERVEPLREEELLRELRDHVWSASSLEVWRSCPVRWFVERMLRAEDLDPDPEPIARGGLAHAALKDTLDGLERESGSARLTRGRLALARTLLKDALERHERDFPLSTVPERRPGLRRRLEADLERYLEHAATHESTLEPRHLELGFGFAREDERGEGSTLAAVDMGGGVMLRGRIDRVDVTTAGGEEVAVVYDYKGRSAPPVAKWIEQGSLQIALYMRAVEQLLGLRAVGGFYQPLAGSDLRARGVLEEDSDVELECVRGDRLERADVRVVLEEAVAEARTAAAQAARGELEARPSTCAFRGGCMYPTICRCER